MVLSQDVSQSRVGQNSKELAPFQSMSVHLIALVTNTRSWNLNWNYNFLLAPDLQHSSLPWAVFTCSRTLIQTHWYLPTVPCSESEQSDIHDHSFEKSKLGFQLSQVWYPKAGCPTRLSLLCFDEVKSQTVTADEYLFWMTLNLLLSFAGPGLFILPVTFMNLHNFPVISSTKTWGWPADLYGRRSSNTCLQWQKQQYGAWLLYSSRFQLNSSLCGTMQQNGEQWWSLECRAWGVW